MQLPRNLQDAIRKHLGAVPDSEIRRASQRMTEAYRGDAGPPAIRDRAETLAYAAVRMPATYAAVRSVLAETAMRVPGFAPQTLLDLGTGPGTALWAAAEIFPSVERMGAVEQNGSLLELGRQLAQESDSRVVQETKWDVADLRTWKSAESFDVVIASYSLGELTPKQRDAVVQEAWRLCAGALVLVEPGTRKGFGVIAGIRQQLLEMDATLAAPCPHGLECPMRAAGDWCHFSARVERSGEHRRIKGGDLGYEDEKFSYVVASKLPVDAAQTRIVRHPLRYSGYTKLQLCTPEGLQERTITRSQKELYRKVKRADWGSGWEE